MKRWTIQELQEGSDRDLISGFLNDRKESCTNPYSPLYDRITALVSKIDKRFNFNEKGVLVENTNNAKGASPPYGC